MVRGAVKKTKKISSRVGKTVQYYNDIKYLGEEPIFANDLLIEKSDYIRYNNWYSYMFTKKEAREFTETYLENTGRISEKDLLKKVTDSRFPDQIGWIARMLSRGANLPTHSINFMNKKITEAIESIGKKDSFEIEMEEPIKIKKEKPNVQQFMKDKISEFIGNFEEMIDRDGYTVSMYDELTKAQIAPNMVNRIVDFYKPISEEATTLLSPECQYSLKEGYRGFTAAQKKAYATFYATVLSDCERYAGLVKAVKSQTRKPRKKKTITTEKRLKFFSYEKENTEYRIASINPEKIFGAQEIWMFNTKYKILSVFYAQNREGLDVHRSSIAKYDEETSKSYRVGSKKAEEVLNNILKGGKRVTQNTIKTLKLNPLLMHRSNENTILLRVN